MFNCYADDTLLYLSYPADGGDCVSVMTSLFYQTI